MANDDLQKDPLQQNDGYFSPTLDEEHLAGDGNPPAAPPEFGDDKLMPPDHPLTDTGVDEGGKYLGGIADETGYSPKPEDSDDSIFPLEADDDVN